MEKIFLVGNPNTGKSTLYNLITKSDEHTGNWHGVTVDAKSKIIEIGNQRYEIFDLPGLYSLNAFSIEEEVTVKYIHDNPEAKILYVTDINNLQRNMYLLFQLLAMKRQIKIFINFFDDFRKAGGEFDYKKLSKIIGCDVEIINPFNMQIKSDFLNFQNNSSFMYGDFTNVNDKDKKVDLVYSYINSIYDKCCVKNRKLVYGESRLDNVLLKSKYIVPLMVIFLITMLYLIFFFLGPKLSNSVTFIINNVIRFPTLNFIKKTIDFPWLIKFLEEGLFSAVITLGSFVPQIALLYLVLSILEDSGMISRMAFVFDDWLNKVGLNGKAVYTMLMGFGCNTTATYTSKNMADKNSRIKTAILTPYMSCSAKLPIYTILATAFFLKLKIWVIVGLYLLGIIVAILLSYIFEKTFLPSKSDSFLIEFPALRKPRLRSSLSTTFKATKQFLLKIFNIILSMSVIVWILSNVTITFRFTSIYANSILYYIAKSISWIFIPIGINNPAIICTLLVGLVAKELILSTMLIFNRVNSSFALISSLTVASSVISFSKASAISFLIFVLLYSPCIANMAVLSKEIGKKFTLISICIEFIIAYLLSMLVYQLFLSSLLSFCIILSTISLVVWAIWYIFKHFKNAKSCRYHCNNCRMCK